MKLSRFFDIVIPRFLEEDTAFDWDDDHGAYVPVCSMRDVLPDEQFPFMGTMRCFNLFGMAICPRFVGELRPFEREPKV
ncbi:hypothetical protein [Serratia fonticola]